MLDVDYTLFGELEMMHENLAETDYVLLLKDAFSLQCLIYISSLCKTEILGNTSGHHLNLGIDLMCI